MKVLFMGTPAFAVPSLLALLDSRHQVIAAVSQPDRPAGRGLAVKPTPVKAAAAGHGVTVLQPRGVRSAEILDRIRSLGPDVLAVAAYGRILPPALLAAAPAGGVNVHGSLLPRYRGAAPAAWAIARGEEITGVTIMRMAEKLDAGDILFQRSTPIGPEETGGGLQARLAEMGAPLLVEALDAMEAGTLAPLPQDEALATYAPILEKEDGRIDWSMNAVEIERRVRAFDPWPGAFTAAPGKTMRIWKARPRAAGSGAAAGEPGDVLLASKEGIVVVCGGGSLLEILEIQPEGGRRMSAVQAVAGRHVAAGARLG